MMLVLIRHASAGDPEAWIGDDRARPLDERGRAQAAALVELLADHPLARVLTSPYLRCVQTVEPLARARRLPLEYRHELGDDAGAEDALALLRELGGEPAAAVLARRPDPRAARRGAGEGRGRASSTVTAEGLSCASGPP